MFAYVEPLAGASGDMLLGALLDCGLPLGSLTDALRALPLPDWHIDATRVRRGALGATQVRVVSREREPPPRRLADVLRIIDAGRLPGDAATQARAIFTLLAEAEARVHGVAVEDVHFHEVGAADAILDICGVAAGLTLLGVDRLYCAALPLGAGSVQTAHGRLPLPAPATLELLARARAPTVPHRAEVELVTPTGAAILGALARFERPPMRLRAVGYGAGSRAEPEPNVLRLALGEPTDENDPLGEREERLVLLECNIDDMNPQWYGHLFDRLAAAGALDVTCAPVLMKKGRPGQLLGVLCRPEDQASLTGLLLAETTTLGVRRHPVVRTTAGRAFVPVETPYGPIAVKLRVLAGRVTGATPEYEACRERALALGQPLAAITQAAQAAALPLIGEPPPDDGA
jgi:uncharacterized protein (TIGR00299 family) protein